jgi:hypothetical protein
MHLRMDKTEQNLSELPSRTCSYSETPQENGQHFTGSDV